MKIKKAPIPADSLVHQVLPANYTDCFRCEFPGEADFTPDDLQVEFWTVMPRWVDRLMKLRNILVRPFGLKTDNGKTMKEFEQVIRSGISSGMSTVPFKNEQETVLKLSDKHLNAYMSVHFEKNPGKTAVSVTTAVHYNNRLGVAYFFVIKPFHKIVVKSSMKSTLDRLMGSLES